jgi:hypothetical protein
VGNIDALIIAIDNGIDCQRYAGPVLSLYEFETHTAVRRINAEWQEELRAGKYLACPEWTKSYVVPRVNPMAKEYGKEKDR